MQIEWEGQIINYLQFGQGKRYLIAFHGFGDRAELFLRLEKSLKHSFTVIALDLPFHGDTKWNKAAVKPEDMASIIKKLQSIHQFEQFSLMGYSMGGRFLLGLFPFFKEELESLLFLAPAGFQPTFTNSNWLFPHQIRRWLKRITDNPKWILSIFAFANKIGTFNDQSYHFLRQQFEDQTKRERIFNSWISLYYFPTPLNELKQFIKEKQLPCYFFYGKSDAITPSKYARRFSKNMSTVQVEEVMGNHFFFKEPLNEALLRTLAKDN